MKKFLFIDGENTVHKLVESLKQSGQVKNRDDLLGYDLIGLLHSVVKAEDDFWAGYYTTKVREIKNDPSLQKRTKAMIRWNSRWAPAISNQGIKYIKSGSLQVRDTKKCAHCDQSSLVMQEKGVDVRMAIDILLAAKPNHELIVVSSDSDLVPALNAAKKLGARVTYVGFSFALNIALIGSSHQTLTIDNSAVPKFLKGSSK